MGPSSILPVIMSGGAGSRLWPLSRKAAPKQLLALTGENTLIQETAARFEGPEFLPPLIVCSASQEDAIRQQLDEAGFPAGAVIVEPMGRNTAPCAVTAAAYARKHHPEAAILLVPADHDIRLPEAFREAVFRAVPTAAQGAIVTFGIRPTGPETGYGYIRRAEALDDGVYSVEAFKEKPDAKTAQTYIADGTYDWNAGIFMFSPDSFLTEARRYAPEIATAAIAAFEAAEITGESAKRVALDTELFAACPSESIDYAVMEHTERAAIVPCDIGWSDVGSFAALREIAAGEDGNAVTGPAVLYGAGQSLVHTDSLPVTLIGTHNIGVIVHNGEVMVLNLDAAQDVKKAVTDIKEKGETGRL